MRLADRADRADSVPVFDVAGGEVAGDSPELMDRMGSFEDAGDSDDDAVRCTCTLPLWLQTGDFGGIFGGGDPRSQGV